MNLHEDRQAIARYVNELQFQNQDEIEMVKLNTIYEAFQYALKTETICNRENSESLNRRATARVILD